MKKIRIRTFNVNNLFERPRILELEQSYPSLKPRGGVC